MLKIHHALLCQDAIIDSHTGQISYIKVIDNLKPTGLPVQAKGLKLGSLWTGDPNAQIHLTIRFVTPSENKLPLGEFTVRFTKESQKIIYTINQLPLLEFGKHCIELTGTSESGESDIYQIPLNILQQHKRLD